MAMRSFSCRQAATATGSCTRLRGVDGVGSTVPRPGSEGKLGNVTAKDSPRIRTGAAGWSFCSNLGICTCYDMIKQDGHSAVASCASFMVCPSSGLLVCWRGKLVLKPTNPDASRVTTLARAQGMHCCQPLHHCSHLHRQLLDLAVVSTRAFSAWHEP